MSEFETWMIRIKGNNISEGYANYCLPSWTNAGFDVQLYDAVTPETIADQPDQIEFIPKGDSRDNTDTEIACFYSQYNLWKRCYETGTPTLVLEHDALLFNPERVFYDDRFFITYFGQHAMEAVLFRPEFCEKILDFISENSISASPFQLMEFVNGIYAPYRSEISVPTASFIGINSPVKCVMDPDHGNTIVHGDVTGIETALRIYEEQHEHNWMWIDIDA